MEIDKIVGVFSAALAGGVAASVGVSSSTKLTEAFIGAGAVVEALGNFAPLSVRTGGFEFSTISAGATVGLEPSNVSLSSSASGLSGTAEVGLPKIGDMDVDRTGGNDATDSSITRQRTTTPSLRNFNGLSVTATNRDDIEVYTISFAAGLVAVAASAGTNVLDNQTSAIIGAGAQVNQSSNTPNASQSVLVASGSDLILTSFSGTLAGGGAKAPSIGVTVVKENTLAEIAANAKVTAKDDIVVSAFGSENMLLAGAGIAVGLGFGAAIDQLSLDNQTTAHVASGVKLQAGGDVVVIANDDTNNTLIAGAVAIGAVGIGASVGVLSIEKDTNAIIDSNAIVDAFGFGSSTANVLSGSKSPDGNSILRSSTSGVIVQSTSTENLTHFAVAAAGAALAGIAGGVAVTIVDSNTLAKIGENALINQNATATFSPVASVYVNSANTVDGFAFAGALAGGAVGVAGAVNVASIRNDTLSDVAIGPRYAAAKM